MLRMKVQIVNNLREFLLSELENRHMSVREFGRESGISHTILSKFINDKTLDHDGFPTEDSEIPSVLTLVRLSRYTHTNLGTLINLVVPEKDRFDLSPEARFFAERWEELPKDVRDLFETLIMTRGLKNLHEGDK